MSKRMTILVLPFLITLFLTTGCSTNHQFVKKPGQTNQSFFQDRVFCQSGASGQNQEETQGSRLVPFAECMLNLGYEQTY